MTPGARAARTAAPFVLIPAIAVGVVAGVVAGWLVGVIAGVVVGVAVAAWTWFAGDSRVIAGIGGRDADPKLDARLWNLVEGLSINAGLRQPRLRVIDSAGLNAMSAGTTSSRAVVGVTSALLDELDRIELEAVLAEELVQIRQNETLPATVLVATFGIGASQALVPDRDASSDQAATALTRYPPALASALEKIEAKGAEVAGQPSHMAHLWLADPRRDPPVARGRLPLSERIEALREL